MSTRTFTWISDLSGQLCPRYLADFTPEISNPLDAVTVGALSVNRAFGFKVNKLHVTATTIRPKRFDWRWRIQIAKNYHGFHYLKKNTLTPNFDCRIPRRLVRSMIGCGCMSELDYATRRYFRKLADNNQSLYITFWGEE